MSYVSYQSMLTQVNTSLTSVKKVCENLDLNEHAESLDSINQRLQNHVFRVGIMGEFKRGKSTVINALLGQSVVPADILPCSATINRIVWDAHPHAEVHFNDGRSPKAVSVDELSNYVTKLTTESEEQASTVEDAVVYYPCQLCQNGVEIIDTPGLNDDERMNYVSESVIPTLDAIIMVLVPGAPFSISEANFVRNKIMTSDLSRLIFVVNKIDSIRERERDRVLKHIKEKIEETVLEKTAKMYGEDSDEYKETRKKLSGIRIYPISAADALDGKLDGDSELLEKSGFPEFESALSKLLTEERGMLELVGPISAVFSKVKEAEATIQMRRNALYLEQEEFETLQKEAMEKIEKNRQEKKRRVKEIKGVAASTYQDMLPMVEASYNELENTVREYVDRYPIDPIQLSQETGRQAFQKELSDNISQTFEACLAECTEKMLVKVNERLSREVEGIEVFDRQLCADIMDIRCSIPSAKGNTKRISGTDGIAIAVETFTNFTNIIPGLGGAISGFKDHGVLGGLIGFGAGWAATWAGAYGSAILLGLLGVATSEIMIPALLISGVVGALGGKAITNKVFSMFGKPSTEKAASGKAVVIRESDIIKIRNQLKDSIHQNVEKLRADQALEKWLKDVTDNTFYGLSEKLDQETEQILQGLQETLTNIQIDLTKGKAHREAVLEKLCQDYNELSNACAVLKPIKDKLDEALCQEAV